MYRLRLFRIFPPVVALGFWVLIFIFLGALTVYGTRLWLKTEIRRQTVFLKERADSREIHLDQSDYQAQAELPDTIFFCGRTFPLFSYTDSLLLKKAMAYFLDRPHLTHLCLVSLPRYQSFVEQALRAHGLPRDLVYVPVVESYLDIFARSPAGAVGLWQFIPATGRQYGLAISKEIDERRDPFLSTQAACRYFNDLFDLFGDWPLVLAAYNTGERRVKKAQKEQGYENYSLLNLPQETRTYVYYVVALKVIADHPAKYFFKPETDDYLQPLQFDTLTFEAGPKEILLSDLAHRAEVSAMTMRDLNPSFLDDKLPKGKWIIRLPQGSRKKF